MVALDVAWELTLNEIAKLLGQTTLYPLLKKLFDQGYIIISEQIKDRYVPKRKAYLQLEAECTDAEGKRCLLDSLNRTPKQQDDVLGFMQLQKARGDITRQSDIEVSGASTATAPCMTDK